jgi:hypothetical protein
MKPIIFSFPITLHARHAAAPPPNIVFILATAPFPFKDLR